MEWPQKIIPRQIRRMWRDRKIGRDHEDSYRQRRQVLGRRIHDLGLTQLQLDDIQHVVIIVIDCLRRDHMSCYDYTRKTSPFMDSLAGQGSFFRDAISPSSWTYPSVISILTGLYPHNHGGVYAEDLRKFNEGVSPRKVSEHVFFLPEILHHFGFATYFSSSIMPAELALHGRFQNVKSCKRKNAQYVLQHYVKWLHTHKKMRTFSYLQLGDLHQRIRVKEPYRSAFGKIPDIPQLGRWDYYHKSTVPGDPAFENYRESRIMLYDAALYYVDNKMREFFRLLEKLQLIDKTLVVITADHGEELWDHMEMEKEYFFHPRPRYGVEHGYHLWQEIVGIPLLLWGPGITSHETDRRVSLVDVMPTVLNYCNIKGWETLSLDGQDLFDTTDNRVILAEDVAFGYEKKAVFDGQYKLYYSKGDGVRWIFDLKNDPYEESPLDLPEVADRLQGFIPKQETTKKEEESLSVDEETKKQLRDLGYIE